MDNELYSLKSVFKGYSFTDLLSLCDGTLHTDDGYAFKIHKIQLVKRSRFFYCLFCEGLAEKKKEFVIPGVKGEILRAILSYIYTGDSNHITEENVCDFLIAADYLLLDDLVQHIKTGYLKKNLSIANCLPLYVTALKIKLNDMCSKIYRYIQTYFEAILTTYKKEIGELPLESLKQFLSDKNLRVTNENSVWMAIAAWVQTDLTDRQSLVPNLLMHLAVSDISEQTATMIVEHSLVKMNPFCEEINRLRQSNTAESNLEIISSYIQQQLKPESVSFDRRLPEQLHFILDESNHIYYVTYDEHYDLWREIEIPILFEEDYDCYPSFLVVVGENIYIFFSSSFNSEGEKVACYNLREKIFFPMRQFVQHLQMFYYVVVQLKGLIYVLGESIAVDMNLMENVAEVYKPDERLWHQISSMMTVRHLRAEVIGGKIYVVGCQTSGAFGLILQAYNSEEDEWIVLNSPTVRRRGFSLFTYLGRLYVIGGFTEDGNSVIRSVEVFDPVTEIWTNHKDLPDIFSEHVNLAAIVLNNKLIVYDKLWESNISAVNPAAKWDEGLGTWTVVEETSSLSSLYKYCFYTHDNGGITNMIITENKDPDTKFDISPIKL